MVSRQVDYLNTVTSMQHILQDLEVSLDRVRTEEENEWKIRYDVHTRYKRCLEMRAHRSAERIKCLREALRDGGLEFHRDYRLNTETFVRRLADNLQEEKAEKLGELEKKESVLERHAKILKRERARRKLVQSELAGLRLGSDSLLWSDSILRPNISEILKEKIDDVVDKVMQNGEDDAGAADDGEQRLSSRLPRDRLPLI
ncbi:uncharacterized protein LOC129583833 [Paramacrobiotus metropolitanus]|uniref:uncharacterized protein LOC129583833 n=1 Tax=Paramacrobiotus metropolitanus TaxID=2943436 RepID=UPI0024456B91|nr:uncharacterized protein LOC129583833 [Paramacrobiotus metropolitanus]